MKITDISRETLLNILSVVESIKSEGVINPHTICQNHNIECSFIDIKKPLAYKAYNPIRGGFDIYISDKVDHFSAKILFYHELGHIFCEKPCQISLFDHTIDPVSEFIANTFAAFMLPLSDRINITEDTTIEEFNEYIDSLILLREE